MKIHSGSTVTAVMAHPDDVKSVIGILMEAMRNDCSVSLVLLTKGEGLKRPCIRDLSPLQIGKLRIKELVTFLKKTGIERERFFLIGIPDGAHALTAMRDDFFKAEGHPFQDQMTGSCSIPYKDVFQPGMEFFGEHLQTALELIMAELQPELILTHFPKDDHMDHRASAFFVSKTVRSLKKKKKLGNGVQVWAPLVYCSAIAWPPEGSFFLTEEAVKRFGYLEHFQFVMSDEEWEEKKKACYIFEKTLGREYIRKNMKKDEVVWRIL